MGDFVLNNSESEVDSDDELQEAFAKGLLKPGLNEVIEKEGKKHVNNITDLKLKLKEFQLKLPWIETLDLVTAVAPMAPDVAMQIQETAQRRKNIKENSKGTHLYDPSQDPVLNEFKRENLIHRQAQAAVVEGLKKLKELNIPTRRPEDYFAEMAKTDEHMQKVRKNLLAKQAAQARTEKVRQLRDQKKIAKRVQIDARLKQASEKREMLEQLKRVRKGKSTDLDFLDDNKNKGKGPQNKISRKRAMKDKKFGFGGKKKGSKLNTRESSSNMDGFNSSAKKKPFDYKNAKNKQFKPKGKKNVRPGKSKRKNAKR
ncbi:probable rRNA-processing protein EBP2 homolog [Leguminivora glycinivorella]|uniref:probable rRNA-processing protein EBP2 homolog n=1 Tax=Leguminivora glycinivorella TaxID=1035111 RepID=UPI00200DEC7F|nr:probable rRNA-processing protein EBP2 homolog [Leguminivora glycinivorella]